MQGVGSREQKSLPPQPLSLALLVLGVLANDANDTAAVNDLALVTDFLY